MSTTFDREALLDAFDVIAEAAVAAGSRLEIAVYGGSALMLASNFRFATEDVDIAALEKPWPDWLRLAVERIAVVNDWSADWLNEAVQFHLSPLATRAGEHVEFGTFPRSAEEPGLVVLVPSADYMLALKLKAMRYNDPVRGRREMADIGNLMRVLGVSTADEAIVILARFFPKSAEDAVRRRFM